MIRYLSIAAAGCVGREIRVESRYLLACGTCNQGAVVVVVVVIATDVAIAAIANTVLPLYALEIMYDEDSRLVFLSLYRVSV